MNMFRLPHTDAERDEIEREKFPIFSFFKRMKKWIWKLFETNKGLK